MRKVQKQTKSSAGPRGPAGSAGPGGSSYHDNKNILIIVVVVVVVVVVVFRSIFTSYYFVQPTLYYTIQGVVGIRLRVTTLLHSVLYCKILQRITVTSLQTSQFWWIQLLQNGLRSIFCFFVSFCLFCFVSFSCLFCFVFSCFYLVLIVGLFDWLLSCGVPC